MDFTTYLCLQYHLQVNSCLTQIALRLHSLQYKCRQIMTRADFLEGTVYLIHTCCDARLNAIPELDRANIISIDVSYA